MKHVSRVVMTIGALVATGPFLAGCIGGPTYGTDKTAGEQLLTDIGEAVSITPGTKENNIKYEPRGNLVKPAEKVALVEPQKNIVAENNPAWVESPEQTRARLRQEADDNADNGNYRSPLMVAVTEGRAKSPEQQAAEYRAARRLQQGAYSDQRRFLSDPPLDYRKVNDPAVLTDLGESESVKEKRRKKEAAIAGTGRKWWELW